MTPKNPESFMKVSRTVSEIFGILLSNPVAYLKKETTRTESIKILLHNPYGAAVVTLLQDLRVDKYCININIMWIYILAKTQVLDVD